MFFFRASFFGFIVKGVCPLLLPFVSLYSSYMYFDYCAKSLCANFFTAHGECSDLALKFGATKITTSLKKTKKRIMILLKSIHLKQ